MDTRIKRTHFCISEVCTSLNLDEEETRKLFNEMGFVEIKQNSTNPDELVSREVLTQFLNKTTDGLRAVNLALLIAS